MGWKSPKSDCPPPAPPADWVGGATELSPTTALANIVKLGESTEAHFMLSSGLQSLLLWNLSVLPHAAERTGELSPQLRAPLE